MFSPLFLSRGDDEGSQQQGSQVLSTDQQQNGSSQQLPQNNRLQEETTGQEVLRAVWDKGSAVSTTPASSASSVGSSSSSQTQGNETRSQGKRTEPQDRQAQEDRKRFKGKENLSKAKLGDTGLDTLQDAIDYCRNILNVQLERARDSNPPMNEAINGDAHVRKTIITLLPDQFVRTLFIEVARQNNAWPRIRPLFGAPPYHFLKPEDAGLIRAAGIAAGRTNMSYEKVNETAGYSQFGAGHLVDDYSREYRVVTAKEPKEGDQLPCNLESIEPQKHIFMNVRVPKRSKAERIELLKDIEKRRAVLFPQVGETITVKYSQALQQVWGKASTGFNSRVLVKSLVPRSANASTAALVCVKVN